MQLPSILTTILALALVATTAAAKPLASAASSKHTLSKRWCYMHGESWKGDDQEEARKVLPEICNKLGNRNYTIGNGLYLCHKLPGGSLTSYLISGYRNSRYVSKEECIEKLDLEINCPRGGYRIQDGIEFHVDPWGEFCDEVKAEQSDPEDITSGQIPDSDGPPMT
ncbi:hypothetical protein QBC35DRAFT_468060 [Podospora australis]|uniref:Uncharacterized protein n=1 Tax=Podospora australis TaxID=1536484 RepID=A0AAN7ACU5_9PEZI|nr:hypothetical protein QBC35DRAFT_468060 [Podospora australis]